MNALKRPSPVKGIYEQPFWNAVQARELRLQKCHSCGHVWYPPGPVCPKCLGEGWFFASMCGRGRLVAWTIFHRQYFPEIPTPYLVASVELEEGPLMIGNVIGLAAEEAKLDLPLQIDFEKATGKDGDWLILQWRQRKSE